MREVSIIIPTNNRKELLGTCLVSVMAQDYPDKEVVVVDDGSNDGTADFLEDNFPQVKIVRNPKSLGPAAAKNQGIINSHGEYILFLDSDSELIFPDTISQMVAAADREERVGSIGGIAEIGSDGEISLVYGKKVSFDGRSYSSFLKRAASDDSKKAVQECDYLDTCNCFVKRELLERTGGFDPYYVYMGEDKEFGMKLKKLGFRNYFGFRFAVFHKYDEVTRFDRRSMYLKARVRYVIKNKGIRYFFFLPAVDICMYFIYYPVIYCLKWLGLVRMYENKRNPNLKTPPAKWMFCAPYHFLRAYFFGLKEIRRTVRSRKEDFLSEESMKSFMFGQNRAAGSFIGRRIESIVRAANGPRVMHATRLRLPEEIVLFITNRCPLKCVFCFYGGKINSLDKEMTLEELTLLAKSLKCNHRLVLTGGEPFLRDDLGEICDVFVKYSGARRISIPTSGFPAEAIYQKVKTISENKKLEQLKISVSIDALGGLHDRLRGRQGAFTNAVASLKLLCDMRLKKRNISVEIAAVVNTLLMEEIEDFIAYFKPFKVPVKFSVMRQRDRSVFDLGEEVSSGLTGQNNPYSPDLEALEFFCEKAAWLNERSDYKFWSVFQEIKFRNQLRLLHEKKRVFPCYAGKADAVIFPDGGVSLCEHIKPFSNLRDKSFDFYSLWHSQEAMTMRREAEHCACIHGCNMVTSMLYDAKTISDIFQQSFLK